MTFYTYQFQEFPYFDKLIKIPMNTIFFRGISGGKNFPNTQILRKDKPIYISSENVAKAYSTNKNNDKFVKIVNIEELLIIDIRKIISLLRIIINDVQDKQELTEIINIFKISLGISTIDDQIQLLEPYKDALKDRFTKLIEYGKKIRLLNTGIRIGITEIDANMTSILSNIFSSYCDGIIAPRLNTVFEEVGKSHEELIIFNVNKLQILNDNVDIKIKNIIDLFTDMKQYKLFYSDIFIGGYYNKFIDKNEGFDDEENYKKIKKLAKLFSKNINFQMPFEKLKKIKTNPIKQDNIKIKKHINIDTYPDLTEFIKKTATKWNH